MIAPEEAPLPSAASFAEYWRAQPQFSRLHAFGLDAYRVAMRLFDTGLEGSLDGASGRLRLTGDGRIVRELKWAEIDGDSVSRLPDLETPEVEIEPETTTAWPQATDSE